MQILRTLTTITEYYEQSETGERARITRTPYRRHAREPYHYRHHAVGRHARAAWFRRIGMIECADGSLARIETVTP